MPFLFEKALGECILRDVQNALKEDVGSGDLSAFLVGENAHSFARLFAREECVLCGVEWLNAAFFQLTPNAQIQWFFKDGDSIPKDSILCEIRAPSRSLLSAERSALNFVQTLSAVATQTRKFVQLIQNTQAQVVDTRKTLPNLRMAQKYAVYCGGGVNHRFGLWDAILIKENHIHAAGGVKNALLAAKNIVKTHPECRFVQIEVENLEELEEALSVGAKMILLDNFSLEMMKEAVLRTPKDVILEASGNINATNILSIAQTGVQRISIGALTKNVEAIDLSLRFF